MVNSRDIKDLHPELKNLAKKFLDKLEEENIDVIITSTYRDNESQNALYALGRTKKGKIVTYAAGGHSYHNYRLAFDIVPIKDGKPVWSTIGENLILWRKIGALGMVLGLEWGGNWKKSKDYPHFQFTKNLSIEDLRNGKNI